MNNVMISIPGDALAGVKIPRQNLDAELKKHLALQLYRAGLVTGAAACRIAGVGKAEFQFLLGEAGICQQYDLEDYHQDLENLRAWEAGESSSAIPRP